ncbi:YjbH domain-containing protein [Pseudooceanicola onchidii]|uniref:YjbH domain-containing protein n=1 Tax=Pseudooceanicola onchidii TaxID=2562279 RepID=UPI001F0F28DF|nr:YjbH domain-containing protein [Pseudooceanicola onchidii]
MPKTKSTLGFALATFAAVQPTVPSAQQSYSYNNYGAPGLIDMPTAQSADDAELSTTISHSPAFTRATMTFQITPRLSGSFRYGTIKNYVIATGEPTFDRSFDLRYRIIDEGRYRPAVAIGLRDIIGTGIYSSEYLVATKHLSPRLTVTGGLGWGRMATQGGFKNPLSVFGSGFNSRPGGFTGTGGQVELGRWFRGQAAFFGGVSYKATDRLTLKAEYSSDAYLLESAAGRNLIAPKTPVNLGLDYRLSDGANLQLAYLHGDTYSFGLTFATNPRKAAVPGGKGGAPIPVKPRDMKSAQALGWVTNEPAKQQLRGGMQTLLQPDGIHVEAVTLDGRQATIFIRNEKYIARAEAIGRTARVLSVATPASVDTFRIVPMVNGMPAAAVVIRRDDLARFEHDPNGAQRMFDAAQVVSHRGKPRAPDVLEGQYPRLTWSAGPYVKASYFDPDNPVRADLGLRFAARYDLAPGLVLSGQVDQRVIGNRQGSTRFDPSALPRVRSDAGRYAKADTALTKLTLASYFRPGENLYGRVTAGYLEPMYAGVSGELLWKPVDSRLALGVEVNYVQQRDFDQAFGLRNYKVATGHVSAYYDFGNGFHGQVDGGRYLAGDWGGTFALDREFVNGWKVGAYATFTNVSFSDFGEGSFDKGIRFEIPLDHFLGRPVGKTYKATLQPLSRDGGARLDVDGRLYDQIRSYHEPELEKSWGRFWR